MIYNYFPTEMRNSIKTMTENNRGIEEIRLRCNQNIVIVIKDKKYYIDSDGRLAETNKKSLRITQEQLKKVVGLMTQNSLYAVENEVKNGFITLKNGCRVGICGKCVVSDGKIEFIKNISSINIRFAKEIKDCGLEVFNQVCTEPKNLLIISPPGYGKTTLLRDIIRLMSNGGTNVSVVDERCELAPIIDGCPVFDLGENTDVLCDLPKSKGINMVLRSMNPQIIATDEIATDEDFEAIYKAINSGVKIFATFHGSTKTDFFNKYKGKYNDIFDNYIYIEKNEYNLRKIRCE